LVVKTVFFDSFQHFFHVSNDAFGLLFENAKIVDILSFGPGSPVEAIDQRGLWSFGFGELDPGLVSVVRPKLVGRSISGTTTPSACEWVTVA